MQTEIISYNVNGIRAAHKKGLLDWMKSVGAGIYCFQEIKALEEQMPIEELKNLGFHVEVYSAEKKGYSGVATCSTETPLEVHHGMGVEEWDKEGRVLLTVFPDIMVVNVYIPSGTTGELRQGLKMEFLKHFEEYLQALQGKYSQGLIVLGDFNIAHTAIDIHNPVANKKSSGFLPEERQWLTDILKQQNLHDAFRLKHPSEVDAYSWWTYRMGARSRNKGWRIDYTVVSNTLVNNVLDAKMYTQDVHSDHCAVSVTIAREK